MSRSRHNEHLLISEEENQGKAVAKAKMVALRGRKRSMELKGAIWG